MGSSEAAAPSLAGWRLRRFPALRWKLLLARLATSVAAVAVTVLVVPGLSIDGQFWLWAAVLGAVFGILNGIVKPALLVLTIRYLFLSYGLVLILVNTATFWLLELLVSPLDIDGGLALLLGGAVIGLVSTVLETLVGITPPIVDPRAEAALAEPEDG